MANVLICEILINNLKLQSGYYAHFQANSLLKGIVRDVVRCIGCIKQNFGLCVFFANNFPNKKTKPE